MKAFQSITEKLMPLKVYNITLKSNIYAELCAYCEALDVHRENLDNALRECFISTSETYGLENREKVIGDIRNNYTIQERREMLCLRNCLGEADFTVEGLERFLKSFGVTDFQLIEMPWQNGISICVGGSYSDSDAAWIENQIKLILPAHLEYYIYFGGLRWIIIDDRDLTYKEFDNLDYTWSKMNGLT